MHYIQVMLPVILLVLTGILLNRLRLLDEKSAGVINSFLFNCSIPALIFVSIATTPLEEILDGKFVLGWLISVLAVFFSIFLIFKGILRADTGRATMASFCASASNTALIALPILIGLYGKKSSIPVAVTIILFVLVLMPFISFLMEFSKKQERSEHIILQALKNTAKNPFLIAGALGVLFTVFSIPLPLFFSDYLHYIGNTTVALALIIIGVGLCNIRFSGKVLEICTVTLANIALKPVISIAFAYYFGLSPFYAISLLVCTAVPTAKTAYIFSKQYHTYEQETAATIFLGSVLTVVSLPLYLWLASHLWPSV